MTNDSTLVPLTQNNLESMGTFVTKLLFTVCARAFELLLCLDQKFPLVTGFLTSLLGKPMIETPAVAAVGKEGDMVTLKCSAYGSPAPQFTWKPSGKEVRM